MNHNINKAVILQVASLLLIVSYSCTQTSALKEASPISVRVSEDRLIRIDKMLQQSIDSGWIAGAVGFIARDGKIVYDKSFGVNDIEAKTLMRRDNIFRIASQTKAITSVAVISSGWDLRLQPSVARQNWEYQKDHFRGVDILEPLIGPIQRKSLSVFYLFNKVRLDILKYRINSKQWFIRH